MAGWIPRAYGLGRPRHLRLILQLAFSQRGGCSPGRKPRAPMENASGRRIWLGMSLVRVAFWVGKCRMAWRVAGDANIVWDGVWCPPCRGTR